MRTKPQYTLEEIQPKHFTHNNHSLDFWNEFGIRWMDTFKVNGVKAYRSVYRKHATGYTHSSNLKYRPRETGKAVMFQTKDSEFWFHLDDDEFEAVFSEEA